MVQSLTITQDVNIYKFDSTIELSKNQKKLLKDVINNTDITNNVFLDIKPLLDENYNLKISPDDEYNLVQHYKNLFLALTQTICKTLAKDWIKLICPQKQATFPYKCPKLPSWWPSNVPHIEPDHLSKDHRVYLLINIIRCKLVNLLELKQLINLIPLKHHLIANITFIKSLIYELFYTSLYERWILDYGIFENLELFNELNLDKKFKGEPTLLRVSKLDNLLLRNITFKEINHKIYALNSSIENGNIDGDENDDSGDDNVDDDGDDDDDDGNDDGDYDDGDNDDDFKPKYKSECTSKFKANICRPKVKQEARDVKLKKEKKELKIKHFSNVKVKRERSNLSSIEPISATSSRPDLDVTVSPISNHSISLPSNSSTKTVTSTVIGGADSSGSRNKLSTSTVTGSNDLAIRSGKVVPRVLPVKLNSKVAKSMKPKPPKKLKNSEIRQRVKKFYEDYSDLKSSKFSADKLSEVDTDSKLDLDSVNKRLDKIDKLTPRDTCETLTTDNMSIFHQKLKLVKIESPENSLTSSTGSNVCQMTSDNTDLTTPPCSPSCISAPIPLRPDQFRIQEHIERSRAPFQETHLNLQGSTPVSDQSHSDEPTPSAIVNLPTSIFEEDAEAYSFKIDSIDTSSIDIDLKLTETNFKMDVEGQNTSINSLRSDKISETKIKLENEDEIMYHNYCELNPYYKTENYELCETVSSSSFNDFDELLIGI